MATSSLKTSAALKRTLTSTTANTPIVAMKLLATTTGAKQDTGLGIVNIATKQSISAEQVEAKSAMLTAAQKLTNVVTTGTASDTNTLVAIEQQKEELQQATDADEAAAVAIKTLTGNQPAAATKNILTGNQPAETMKKSPATTTTSETDGAITEEENTGDTTSEEKKPVEAAKNLLDKAITWVQENEKIVLAVVVLLVVVYIVKH